jgi:hypothetical protein
VVALPHEGRIVASRANRSFREIRRRCKSSVV